jgi:hypothetical protein
VAQPAVKPAAPHPDQGKLRRNSIPDALALADTDADGPSYDGAYASTDLAEGVALIEDFKRNLGAPFLPSSPLSS